MLEWWQPFTAYLHAHPWLAITFAGLVAFLESLAIIGTIIPGSVTLTAVGVMMGSGIIPVYPTLAAAIIGAVLGDVLSYFIGRYYHGNIRKMWPFTSYPNLLTQGEAYFRQHGGKSIFFGRFVGPIRAILPLIAGMLDMPFGYFIVSDIFSAIFWAPAYLLPGMLVGAATLELPPQAATHLILYLLLGLVLASIAVWILRRITAFLLYRIDRILASFWLFCRRHHTLNSIPKLMHHNVSKGHRQLAFLLSMVLSLLLVVIILTQPQWLSDQNSLNRAVFSALQSLRTPYMDDVMLIITYFGEKLVIYFTIGITLIFLFSKQLYRACFFVAFNLVVSSGIIGLCKHLIYSPRPQNFISVQTSHSFPSGHAGLFTANVMFIAWLLGRQSKRISQKRLGLLTVSLALLIASTRLYLGDHWLIDVIAGMAIGTFSASLSAFLFSFRSSPTVPIRATLLALLPALFLGVTIYGSLHFQKDKIGRTHAFNQVNMTEQAWWQQQQPVLDRYRHNRFDVATDFLNVQWLAEQTEIEKTLRSHGWKNTAPTSSFEILKRIFAKDKTQVLPVFPKLFYYREPDILLVKSSAKEPLLILRLWKVPGQIQNQSDPLWIGFIEHQLIWRNRWLRQHQELINHLPEPLSILLNDSSAKKHKVIYYLNSKRVRHETKPHPEQKILLLES